MPCPKLQMLTIVYVSMFIMSECLGASEKRPHPLHSNENQLYNQALSTPLPKLLVLATAAEGFVCGTPQLAGHRWQAWSGVALCHPFENNGFLAPLPWLVYVCGGFIVQPPSEDINNMGDRGIEMPEHGAFHNKPHDFIDVLQIMKICPAPKCICSYNRPFMKN